MVAIVSGDSLGLSNTSAGVLGNNGLIGQAVSGATNELAAVNVSNGNLVLQTDDDTLIGQGLDIDSVLTYNSQGSLSDQGNGMGWSLSMVKVVDGLTGSVNTTGSTITRTDGDGDAVVYTYAGNGIYVGHEGSGPDDTLVYNGNDTWTWTDGATNAKETYGANGYIEPDPDVLKPWLLAACDRHTHQSQVDTESVFYDFSSFPRMPLEILFLFRLREMVGLKNPHLEHPLMEAPFDRLPIPQLPYAPDEFVLGTLARVRKDWPNFDDLVSLPAILTSAGSA